jgi:hypothetical protein
MMPTSEPGLSHSENDFLQQYHLQVDLLKWEKSIYVIISTISAWWLQEADGNWEHCLDG